MDSLSKEQFFLFMTGVQSILREMVVTLADIRHLLEQEKENRDKKEKAARYE